VLTIHDDGISSSKRPATDEFVRPGVTANLSETINKTIDTRVNEVTERAGRELIPEEINNLRRSLTPEITRKVIKPTVEEESTELQGFLAHHLQQKQAEVSLTYEQQRDVQIGQDALLAHQMTYPAKPANDEQQESLFSPSPSPRVSARPRPSMSPEPDVTAMILFLGMILHLETAVVVKNTIVMSPLFLLDTMMFLPLQHMQQPSTINGNHRFFGQDIHDNRNQEGNDNKLPPPPIFVR